jgi:hypothetical protein
MNLNLAQHILDAVNRFWAAEVDVIGIWDDGPSAVCVVYRRAIDPAVVLGRRLELNEEVADGTVEGFARDAAINFDEPIGTASSRQDIHGIAWVAVPENRTTPMPPFDVLQKLSKG